MNEYVRAVVGELGKKLDHLVKTDGVWRQSTQAFFDAVQKQIDQARRLCEAMDKAGGGK